MTGGQCQCIATTCLRHVCYTVPFHYCSNCKTFLEFLLLTSLPISSQICLTGSEQEIVFKIVFKIQAMALKKGCKHFSRHSVFNRSLFCWYDAKYFWAASDETSSKARVTYTTTGESICQKVEAKPWNLNRDISITCSTQLKQSFLMTFNVFCRYFATVAKVPDADTCRQKYKLFFLQFLHEY